MSESLSARILELLALPADALPRNEAREVVDTLLSGLNAGSIRAATRSDEGSWMVHAWVKQGILLAFRTGQLTELDFGGSQFWDRDTLPVRRFRREDGVRLVPGGSAVRAGAHMGSGVVCMPPSYVNIGAFVGSNSMVDSHVLVGSCAQVGRHVHLSAGVQVGGVLEPIGARPVIIEDEVFVGGGCGLFEGVLIRERAVLAPGVMLTGSTRVFDLVHERIVERKDGHPLEIPSGAVVVPGSRPASTDFGRRNGIALYTPIIVKYRDERTDAATALEGELRGG